MWRWYKNMNICKQWKHEDFNNERIFFSVNSKMKNRILCSHIYYWLKVEKIIFDMVICVPDRSSLFVILF